MSDPTLDSVLQAILQVNRRGQVPSIVAVANLLDCSVEAVRACCDRLVAAGKLRRWQPVAVEAGRPD